VPPCLLTVIITSVAYYYLPVLTSAFLTVPACVRLVATHVGCGSELLVICRTSSISCCISDYLLYLLNIVYKMKYLDKKLSELNQALR